MKLVPPKKTPPKPKARGELQEEPDDDLLSHGEPHY
ncbi:hypothetical protein DFR45_11535, partial [Extensimonas vulgaris]